jgi:hypothetical protein
MRLAGHVALMKWRSDAYRVWVAISEGGDRLKDPCMDRRII